MNRPRLVYESSDNGSNCYIDYDCMTSFYLLLIYIFPYIYIWKSLALYGGEWHQREITKFFAE